MNFSYVIPYRSDEGKRAANLRAVLDWVSSRLPAVELVLVEQDRERQVVAVSNFTPLPRQGYRVGVPAPGFYRERLNTDSAIYGGSDVGNGGGVEAEEVSHHGRPYSISLTLPPLGTLVLERA